MSNEQTSFQAGIDFESVLRIISKQVYETPLAFIRENVQNSVDAVRIQAHRDSKLPEDNCYKIDVTVAAGKIIVKDDGIGMSADDLRNFFWTIGASGKRTQEALAAGCVGTFGIGGFANFGVCGTLEVISQTKDDVQGTLTRLSESDIRTAGSAIPHVTTEGSNIAAPRGTVVIGHLREAPNLDELRLYLLDFARFVPVAVYFNGQKISQSRFSSAEERQNYSIVGAGKNEWQNGELVIAGQLFEDGGHTLVASIEGLTIGGKDLRTAPLARRLTWLVFSDLRTAPLARLNTDCPAAPSHLVFPAGQPGQELPTLLLHCLPASQAQIASGLLSRPTPAVQIVYDSDR